MTKPIEIIAIWLLFFCAVSGYGASFMWNTLEHPERSIPFGILWHQLKFFTLWTNILLIFLSGFMALKRRYIPDSLIAAITLWMLIVFAVWHGLLADGEPRYGFDFYSNALGHTVNPLLLFGIWLAFAPKSALRWRDPAIWLLWPLAYVIYAVTRGILTGFYPYFFINLDELGWGGLLNWSARFLVAFYLAGLLLTALGKTFGGRISRQAQPR